MLKKVKIANMMIKIKQNYYYYYLLLRLLLLLIWSLINFQIAVVNSFKLF